MTFVKKIYIYTLYVYIYIYICYNIRNICNVIYIQKYRYAKLKAQKTSVVLAI